MSVNGRTGYALELLSRHAKSSAHLRLGHNDVSSSTVDGDPDNRGHVRHVSRNRCINLHRRHRPFLLRTEDLFLIQQLHGIGKQRRVALLHQADIVAALHSIDNSSKWLHSRHALSLVDRRCKSCEPRTSFATVAAIGSAGVGTVRRPATTTGQLVRHHSLMAVRAVRLVAHAFITECETHTRLVVGALLGRGRPGRRLAGRLHRSRRILSGTLLVRALLILAHIAAAPALLRLRLTVMPVICGGAVLHRNLRDGATDRRELAEAGSFTLKMLPITTALISGRRLRRLRNEGRYRRCTWQRSAPKCHRFISKAGILRLNRLHSAGNVGDSQTLVGRQLSRFESKAKHHVPSSRAVVHWLGKPLGRLTEPELFDRVPLDLFTHASPGEVVDERTPDFAEAGTVDHLRLVDPSRHNWALAQEPDNLGIPAQPSAITEALGNLTHCTNESRHAINLAL